MKLISRQRALAIGAKYYFTGKPCCHGHVDRRSVKNRICRACGRESYKRWNGVLAYFKAYNAEHRDWQTYYAEHREARLETQRRYQATRLGG